MTNRWDIWDLTIIFGSLLILVWALLKAFGIIHSPVWVEMVPYFGGGTAILGAAYKLGKIKKGIEDTEKKVDKILKIENIFENAHIFGYPKTKRVFE